MWHAREALRAIHVIQASSWQSCENFGDIPSDFGPRSPYFRSGIAFVGELILVTCPDHVPASSAKPERRDETDGAY